MILPGEDASAVAAAVERIRRGGQLGLPTETVYGLAADAANDAAVAAIFAAKGRPADHPLIVHVADAQAATHFTAGVPDFARALMAAFWPGPLTLILPRRPDVAVAAAGGHASVGLRCPSHPVARALLQALAQAGVWGVAAPSANQFGRVSPTTAQHVQGEFGDDLLILDGGPCEVGIESTIIDCTRGRPVLLRPGAITPAQVQSVTALAVVTQDDRQALAAPAPKASGTLASHYAPRARVRLMDRVALQQALKELSGQRVAVWAHALPDAVPDQVLLRRMPTDPATAARQLFAVLREFDAQGVDQIWVELPPDTPPWAGVRDRLQRAAA